jgi:hypothetical protein
VVEGPHYVLHLILTPLTFWFFIAVGNKKRVRYL